jgi:hypothetical protein
MPENEFPKWMFVPKSKCRKKRKSKCSLFLEIWNEGLDIQGAIISNQKDRDLQGQALLIRPVQRHFYKLQLMRFPL